jgi:hypothetical protein
VNTTKQKIPQQTVIEYVHGKRRFSNRLMRQVMSLGLAEARNKARIEASRSNAADKKQYEDMLFNEAEKELNRRLGNNRSPRGVLVAVKVSDTEFSIGHASCRKNEKFNRDRALEIALGRAFAGFDRSTASYEVEEALSDFIARCKKYYKGLSLAFKPIRVGQPGVFRASR